MWARSLPMSHPFAVNFNSGSQVRCTHMSHVLDPLHATFFALVKWIALHNVLQYVRKPER